MDGSNSEARNKALLNHEQGQGSTCHKCGPKCPGLDLHFWRKLCKNCGCKFEDHDVRINEKVHESIVHNLKAQASGEKTVVKGPAKAPEQKKEPTTPDSSRQWSKPLKPPVPAPNRPTASGTSAVDFQVSKQVGEAKQPPTGSSTSNQASVEIHIGASSSLLNGDVGYEVSSKLPMSSSGRAVSDDVLADLDFLQIDIKSGISVSPENRHPKMEDLGDLEVEDLPPPLEAEDTTSDAEERARQLALVTQLPPQDFDPEYCHDLSANEREEMSRFTKKMQDEAFGQGSNEKSDTSNLVCADCDRSIDAGQEYILAQRIPDKTWHSECFKCHICHQLLVDLMYFYRDDDIYCGRHYAELMKVRCAACDELIFDLEYTQAEGKEWHTKHFCCFECEVLLGGHSYVLNNSQPYCIDCYHLKIADRCFACKRPIEVGSERISYEERNWHNDPACFCCNFCGKRLRSEYKYMSKSYGQS